MQLVAPALRPLNKLRVLPLFLRTTAWTVIDAPFAQPVGVVALGAL